ncbi:hypothetical protein QGM71_02575 [Virgibacillus sp. C22-A2]|uniref:Uncharacterized protein n=1 Tax=Virgibacillus tibetensis TaxID=3042313 RepID=A0ABU6KB24_9BACI|nr:hypothetical protein [Virgibacillus sp. C22-A2]
MTVEELIEELKMYNPKQKVWVRIEGAFRQVSQVDEDELINDDDLVIS